MVNETFKAAADPDKTKEQPEQNAGFWSHPWTSLTSLFNDYVAQPAHNLKESVEQKAHNAKEAAEWLTDPSAWAASALKAIVNIIFGLFRSADVHCFGKNTFSDWLTNMQTSIDQSIDEQVKGKPAPVVARAPGLAPGES
jgi:hypothetical protein